MTRTLLYTLTLAGLAVVASGCALGGYDEDFSCGAERGEPCKSATDVYKGNDGGDADAEGGSATGSGTSVIMSPWSKDAGLSMPGIDKPKPVRTPSRVMRIYVAPWVSEDGSLTMPSYVYTEVTPRKWSIGEDTPAAAGSASSNLRPLTIKGNKPDSQGQDNNDAPPMPTPTGSGQMQQQRQRQMSNQRSTARSPGGT